MIDVLVIIALTIFSIVVTVYIVHVVRFSQKILKEFSEKTTQLSIKNKEMTDKLKENDGKR